MFSNSSLIVRLVFSILYPLPTQLMSTLQTAQNTSSHPSIQFESLPFQAFLTASLTSLQFVQALLYLSRIDTC